MNKKANDLRYIKTERAIRKAFHELLQEKDLRRITVRELVDRAEINKTTFYSHYETLPDLIDTLEREKINYILDNLDEVLLLYHDPDQFIDNMYRNLRDCQIYELSLQGAGGRQFVNRLKDVLSGEIKERGIHVENYQDTSAILVFILHGLLGVMNTEGYTKEHIEAVKRLVKTALKGHQFSSE